MRPKFVALLAVPALALVGCSAAAETAPEPAETAPVSATPSASAEPSTSQEAFTDEDAFVEMLDHSLGLEASKYVAELQPKLTEEYWIERGNELCKDASPGEPVEIHGTYGSAEEYRIESSIAISAASYLCPVN